MEEVSGSIPLGSTNQKLRLNSGVFVIVASGRSNSCLDSTVDRHGLSLMASLLISCERSDKRSLMVVSHPRSGTQDKGHLPVRFSAQWLKNKRPHLRETQPSCGRRCRCGQESIRGSDGRVTPSEWALKGRET